MRIPHTAVPQPRDSATGRAESRPGATWWSSSRSGFLLGLVQRNSARTATRHAGSDDQVIEREAPIHDLACDFGELPTLVARKIHAGVVHGSAARVTSIRNMPVGSSTVLDPSGNGIELRCSGPRPRTQVLREERELSMTAWTVMTAIVAALISVAGTHRSIADAREHAPRLQPLAVAGTPSRQPLRSDRPDVFSGGCSVARSATR